MLAEVIAQVVHGQVRELETTYNPERSEQHYFDTISEKTASLFEASARLGASLSGCEEDWITAAGSFGSDFGFAFQIADDLLDLAADREELGKSPGTDVRDGVYTLPVILAVSKDPSLKSELGRSAADLDKVRRIVAETGAYSGALELASKYADKAVTALRQLPDSAPRRSLESIGQIVVRRVPPL
jgi:geranylgeranyl pyrophosphate synthase